MYHLMSIQTDLEGFTDMPNSAFQRFMGWKLLEIVIVLEYIVSTPSIFDTLAAPTSKSVAIIKQIFVLITWLRQLVVSLQLLQCE